MIYCMALDKVAKGRRELWAICRQERGHQGLHHDPKFPAHHWPETFFAFEFEYGRPRKMPSARKVALCKACGKRIRTDGAPEACVCKETGANKRQAIMFADERRVIANEASARDLQDDIDWVMKDFEKQLMERCEGYDREW